MKNKISNYDFLIVGAGLVGSIAAIALHQKKYTVLVVEKNNLSYKDQRTLAVNANSREFLKKLGIWKYLKKNQECINKILIKDYINKKDLTFQNSQESMGSVIFNKSLLKIARDFLIREKILLTGINFDLSKFKAKTLISFNNKQYSFNKMIVSLGKNYENYISIKKSSFYSSHHAYVGFFSHSKNHNQIAYEIFTTDGPLAVLPSPSKQKKSSTFIYSTKNKMNAKSLSKLIKKHFELSHGKIDLKSSINSYAIRPHLSRPILKDILLIGDTAHSIHPVAGQGWNLGIKDIQELCNCLDLYALGDLNFDKIYYSKRLVENFSYLAFTNILNFLYETKTPITNSLIKASFNALIHFPNLKKLFIRQAMGKIKLV